VRQSGRAKKPTKRRQEQEEVDQELEDQRANKKAKVSEGKARRKNEDKAKTTLDAILPPRAQNGRRRR